MNTNPKPVEVKFYAVLVCLLIVLFVAFAADSSKAGNIADNEPAVNDGYENYKAAQNKTAMPKDTTVIYKQTK